MRPCLHITVVALLTASWCFRDVSSRPVMVTFGTSGAPIRPPDPPASPPRFSQAPKVPAPVSEAPVPDDLPPPVYVPPRPLQYLHNVQIHPLLVLGPAYRRPIDKYVAPKQEYSNPEKYSPAEKYATYKKLYKQQQVTGKRYTGPHLFEKQAYEYLPQVQFWNAPVQRVPTAGAPLGVYYSGGVRYYVVPQVVDPLNEEENSVYDRGDPRHHGYNRY